MRREQINEKFDDVRLAFLSATKTAVDELYATIQSELADSKTANAVVASGDADALAEIDRLRALVEDLQHDLEATITASKESATAESRSAIATSEKRLRDALNESDRIRNSLVKAIERADAAVAEATRATAENETLRRRIVPNLEDDVRTLTEDNERYVEALEFYSKRSNVDRFIEDGGRRARAALRILEGAAA